MKKLFYILLLFSVSMSTKAQVTQYLGGPKTTIEVRGVLVVDSSTVFPQDTLASAANGSFATKNGTPYYKTSGHWFTLISGGGGVTTASGDASGTASGSNLPLTLATVNSNVGTFGTASSVGSVTLNAKGLTTAGSNIPILITESQVTNLTSDLASKLTANQTITLTPSGDVTGTASGTTSITPVFTIGANKVTYAKIQASSQQALLGSQTAGNYGEITLGPNISMVSSVLNSNTDSTSANAAYTKYGSDTSRTHIYANFNNYFPIIGGSLTGTGGTGYLGLPTQTTSPSALAGVTEVYRDSAGGIGFRYPSGFVNALRALSTHTANRSYYFPDSSGTFMLSNLPAGQMWIGNSSGLATGVAMTGRGTLSNTGVFALTSTGITPGSYTNANVTVTADGTISVISNGTGGGGGGGGIGTDSTVTITSGSSSTVTNGYNIVRFNPTSVISSYTLTLPTTWHTSNDLLIVFTANGTITSGNPMVTTLTIVNGSGQTLSQAVIPTTGNAGEIIRYHLIAGTIDQRLN